MPYYQCYDPNVQLFINAYGQMIEHEPLHNREPGVHEARHVKGEL